MVRQFKFPDSGGMDVLGLGTWQMTDGVAYDAVKSAIGQGYRHIDCAWVYGNEADVGRALKECISEKIVSREELWITSKLWNDRHRGEHVAAALKEQLSALQLDSLDLYLIHWPVVHQFQKTRPESYSDFLTLEQVPLTETWQAMLECVQQGLCRHVGVANFNVNKIQQLIDDSGVVPACNQVESHVLLQQHELFDYCKSNDIAFVAYSPLGSGGRPETLKKATDPNLFEIELVQTIASELECTSAQVLLAWCINRGAIAIPKSSNPGRQKENFAASNIKLSGEQMTRLSTLETGYRYVDGTFWEIEGGPYKADSLWNH